MNARPWDAVLFDLDGTLIDTAPDIADAVNGVRADCGLPPVPESWVRERIGNGARQLLVQADLTGQLENFADYYAQCCGRRGRLYPYAASTLDELRRAGVKLALLTNKEQRFARLVLEVHRLDHAFDVQICGDTLSARKPDPLPVAYALAMLDVPASQALLVGDSRIDVQCARNAGIAVWAVGYGYGRCAELAQVDRIIGSLAEVADAYAPRASSNNLYLRSNPLNWS